MMNKNARKWIKALRSGEFKQTKGKLQDKNGFCCLGVACNVYEKETGEMLPRGKDGFYDRCSLYENVTKWLGLRYYSGEFINDDESLWAGLKDDVGSLVYYNDDMKYDFNKIADVIEENEQELFIQEEKQ